MTEVKRPILLGVDEYGNQLADQTMLHPAKGTLKLQMEDVSECTLTLEDKAESIGMHRWVKIWNTLGFVGFFRRTSKGRNIGTDNSYTLRHGIDILQDSIWDAEETFAGTKTQFLTAILNKQTQLIQGPGDSSPRKPWVLGSCADSGNVKKDIKYDNLMDLFEGCVEQGGGYYFTYNMNVWPWQVSLVAKPDTVASEFRLDRNMEKCQIKDNDSELCTRLVLSVNKMVKDDTLSGETADGSDVNQNATVVRTYNNSTAQSNYGIIVKTADIDVENDTFPNGPFPEADAWAADFMARRAEPMLQVEIDGAVLKGVTGDDWDETKIATKVQVALPDYATAIAERCVTITYPEMYGDKDRITVSLANALPTYTKSMATTQKQVTRNTRSGRASARQAKNFVQHFQITDKTGKVLQQAGMKLDANGMLVYADDNVNMVGARFNVQADKIGMVVGTNQDGNYIKAGEIALEINKEGSTARINANRIIIGSSGSTTTLNDCMTLESTGIKIKKITYFGEAGANRVTINSGVVTAAHLDTTNGGNVRLYDNNGNHFDISYSVWSTMLASAEVTNGDVRLNDNSGTYMRIYVDGDDLKFKDRQGNVMTFSKPASTHTITEFDTNAIAGESSDGYTNNNQFFSISGSGSTAEVAIVITGTWKCDGVSRTANRYVKRASTNVYKRGWNDCRSRAMNGTPMYDGAGNAYYRLPSAI